MNLTAVNEYLRGQGIEPNQQTLNNLFEGFQLTEEKYQLGIFEEYSKSLYSEENPNPVPKQHAFDEIASLLAVNHRNARQLSNE